jgi:hypothetical protein
MTMIVLEQKSEARIAGDRRADRRYALYLDLRWKLIRRRKVLDSGTGRTVDLSSSGILFHAGRQLPVGLTVELSIAWPALLHNIAPMQLIVSGKIVRIEGNRCAVRMTRHEFRTAGAPGERNVPASTRAPRLMAAAGAVPSLPKSPAV